MGEIIKASVTGRMPRLPANWHVIPVNDSQGHVSENTCACKPVGMQAGESTVWVHNSYDGREGLELANEILYPKD